MAKGQFLSNYQKGIVNRYYEHLDTIALTKLSEAVSELYLCTDAKKADKLWKSVDTALARTASTDPQLKAKIRQLIMTRDVKTLASIVNDLSAGKKL